MNKVFVLIIIFSGVCLNSFAQQFEWEAELNEVDTNSYYNIFINPLITSKLNYKFSDIRIFDEDENEIPFVRRSEIIEEQLSKKFTLNFIENQHKISKKLTSVIVGNAELKEVPSFKIIIENTNAEVWINISGSNDAKSWELLKENKRYQPEISDSLTAEINITDIPASKYEYYKILIYDYNTEVIKVKAVYNFIITKAEREFTEVLKPSFKQDNVSEEGHSIINISFPEEQYIDKITFEISNPLYYLRKAELTKKDSLSGKKIKLEYYDQKQTEFNLCSDSCNDLFLSRYKAKELFLVIDNNDDAPLQISDIKAYQENEYFIAYLEKGKKYFIRYRNINVSAPIYDLKFFKNKIPLDIETVEVKNIVQLYNPKTDINRKIYIKPELLWIALGVIVVILGLISFKVFRKSEKENNQVDQNNF